MRLGVRAAAALSGAVGAWFTLGAVAIAPGATVASRVGVLPPWWVLGLLAVAFLLLVFGLRLSTARAAPLFGAWLCVLPWVPGRVPPSLLAWQGWLAAIVWVGLAVATIAAEPVAVRERWRRWVSSPSQAPWLAGALAALVFGFAWSGTGAWLPGGDEPHYLVITQSLLEDGDLRIEDNHRRGDYLSYFPGELRPDYLRRGTDGQIYSIHAPGISALVAPAFLVGGYRGAAAFVLICCALGTALAWRLAWDVTRRHDAAWFGWAVLATSVPIVAHAYTIYPDGTSGVLVLVGVIAFLRAAGTSPWPLVAGGVALAALPWLHTRNVVIAAGLGSAVAGRIAWAGDGSPAARARRLVAFLAVPAVAAVGWFGFFKVVYGTFDPSAPYGGYTQSSLQNIARGVMGLMVDQQFGALATAPVLWAAVVGTTLLAFSGRPRHEEAPAASAQGPLPTPRSLALVLALTFVPYLLVTASYHMWWGGTSAPARFLVPVLWTAALPAALAWRHASRPADRAVWLALLTLSIAITASMSHAGKGLLTFTTRAEHAPFVEWATRAVDLSLALPSVLRDPPLIAAQRAIPWALALLAWWLALRLLGRTATSTAAAVVPLAVLTASVAMAANWRAAEVDPLRLDPSRRAALDASWADGVGLTFQRFDVEGRRHRAGLIDISGLLPILELTAPQRGRPRGLELAGISGLPAGTYRVKVSGTSPRTGRVRVEVGRGGRLVEHELAALPLTPRGRAFFDLDLPVGVDSLVVVRDQASSATGAAVTALRIDRTGLATRDHAIVARRYPGADVFFTTDAQYPEAAGFWVKAGEGVPVVVHRSEPAPRLPVFVRNGPLENEVVLSSDSWTVRLPLAPGEETTVEWPWEGGARTRLLRVSAREAFRPADIDPASQDLRRLGVWLEFR